MTISAVIITRNSSKKLSGTLQSLKGFQEVLVCDLDSTDDTAATAAASGARVIKFPYTDKNSRFAARNFALKSVRSHWVLFIESGEIITRRLNDRLHEFIRNTTDINGLYIPHKHYYLNRFNHTAYPDYQLRFFKKDRTFWGEAPDADPEVSGSVSKLPAGDKSLAISHLPQTIAETIEKLNHATDEALAETSAKKVSLWKMMLLPKWEFLKTYIFKGAIVCGVDGYICARNESVKKYFILAKSHDAATSSAYDGADSLNESDSSSEGNITQ